MATTDNKAEPVPTKMEVDSPKPAVDGEDITGDGGVIKKTLKAGSGWEHPKGGAEVRSCSSLLAVAFNSSSLCVG